MLEKTDKGGTMLEKSSNSNIAVIMATLNEELGIGPTIRELRDFVNDSYILVVDGKSFDRTIEIAKEMSTDVVLQNGKGKGQAIDQGLKLLDPDTRYVVFIDADYTYPAEFIPKMIEVLEQSPEVGMVIGNRFNHHFSFKSAMNDTFYAGNRFLAYAQHLLNGIKLSDPLSGLRVARAEILRNWKPKSSGFDVEAEMNFFVERRGYEIKEIPISYRQRMGKKKLKIRHGVTILRRMMTESLGLS